MTTEDIEIALISYIRASKQARVVLSQLRGFEITPLDIQNALCEKLDIKDVVHPNELLKKNLTEEIIVNLLKDFNFKKYHPEILVEVELEEQECILPSNTARLLTEKTVKVKGEVWQIHKNDADPFPSVPHAHNYDAGLTLHLGTGELFNSNRKNVGSIGKKKLNVIRGKLNAFQLPDLDL